MGWRANCSRNRARRRSCLSARWKWCSSGSEKAACGFAPGAKPQAAKTKNSAPGRVLPVDPRAFELLVRGRLQQAALVAGVPADDLVRLAALLAAGLPLAGPRTVRLLDDPLLLVPEQHLALAV